jgi:hypothetical protein
MIWVMFDLLFPWFFCVCELLHRHNVILETLWLGANRISVDGAVAIGDALRYERRTTLVWCMYRTPCDFCFTNCSISMTFGVAPHTRNRSCLHFNFWHLHSPRRNTTLQVLSFGENPIGDDGAVAIGEGLRCEGIDWFFPDSPMQFTYSFACACFFT